MIAEPAAPHKPASILGMPSLAENVLLSTSQPMFHYDPHLEPRGWRGLSLDAAAYPAEYGVKQERVDAININPILRKYRAPDTPDLISIDGDGQDFWIWSNLVHRPNVLVIEYNANFAPDECKVMPRFNGTARSISARACARFTISENREAMSSSIRTA